MHHYPPNSSESNIRQDCVIQKNLKAFGLAIERTMHSGKKFHTDTSFLLNCAGFSQNGRNRMAQLSGEEVDLLAARRPVSEDYHIAYGNEIQALLSQIDQVRKRDFSQGRAYVTESLVCVVGKLCCLRLLEQKMIIQVPVSDLRLLLMDNTRDEWFVQYIANYQHTLALNDDGGISIQSAIQLLLIYRDELIAPPRLCSKLSFDEFTSHKIETSDFSDMDDGGESFLEAIQNVPLVTYYDELPDLDSVLDWFLSEKPVFDRNQIKRGWFYIKKSSDEWYRHNEKYRFYEDILQYPSWNCVLDEYPYLWLSIRPTENPYKIIPLTTPQQLLTESKLMNHCVITYLGRCMTGNTRIFSVQDAENLSVATAELSLLKGEWVLVQLKGKHNQELMPRISNSTDPLSILLGSLVKLYNVTGIV